jgi:hypothetical protein
VLIGGLVLVIGFGVWFWHSLPTVGPQGERTDASAITFWHDDARHVGCWIFATGYKGGISCLPDGQYERP